MIMMKKVVLFLSILLSLTACSNTEPSLKKESEFLGYITDENNDMVLLLNTETTITTVDTSKKQELIDTAKEEIVKYHKLLDSHHYYLDSNNNRLTNLKVLNDNINNGPIKVDPIIIDALNQAIDLTILTHGYFNISLGRLSALYKDKLLPYDSINTDPNVSDIENEVKGIVNIEDIDNYIIIDKENSTVELKAFDYPYELDLGAFSKGYIIDNVYRKLIKYNTSFLLTAGSSSIVTYKASDEDISWNIGLKKPENQTEALLSFNLNTGCISTSGDYENYYLLEDGTRRHHILNPYTGYSENFYRSNTLLSNNACVIDALSTALFSVENSNERAEIIKGIEDYYDIKIQYCFVKDSNNLIMNQGFKDTLNNKDALSKIESIVME